MVVLAQIVLSPIALDSFIIISVLLGIVGTLYLAYDLLGRQHGPLQWLTVVITCGLVSAIVLGFLAPTIRFLSMHLFDFGFTFQAIIIGGLMGVFTAALVDFSPAQSKPPLATWSSSGMGLGMGVLFFFVTFFLLHSLLMSSLIIGLTCATLASLWSYLTWNPSASKPQVFSRRGLGIGLLLGLLFWFVFFFISSRDVVVALLASVPFVLVCGALSSLWRFIHWEASSPQLHVFSRKGLLAGFVIGFIPWLTFQLAENYANFLNISGPVAGFELLGNIVQHLVFIVGSFALANAAAGSISRYILWKANELPLRTLGAIGLMLILLSLGFQVVAPVIDIINIVGESK